MNVHHINHIASLRSDSAKRFEKSMSYMYPILLYVLRKFICTNNIYFRKINGLKRAITPIICANNIYFKK